MENRDILLVGLGILAVITVIFGFGGSGMPMGGFFMPGFGLLFWIAVIYLIVNLLSDRSDRDKGRSPLEILKERYARGEITKEEFQEMGKAITD